jgi:hypothetical protein
MDFEIAMINAVEEMFPRAEIVGCLFHFKQALRRKLIKLRVPLYQVSFLMIPGVLDILTVIPIEEIKTIGIPFVKKLLGNGSQVLDQFWEYV